MVDLTLKDGIEETLMEKLPDLTKVLDITDYSNRENAYYKSSYLPFFILFQYIILECLY